MSWIKSSTGFQFNKDNTAYHQVSVIRANLLSVEPNGNGSLLLEFKPAFFEIQWP